MKRVIGFIVLTIMILGIITGCSTQASEKKLKIVTTFYPLYIFTSNIVQGVSNVEIENLTQNATGCIHDYTLSTKEMQIASEADILIINGLEMESFVDEIKSNNKNVTIIEATKDLPVIVEGDEPNSHIWMSIKGAMGMVNNIAKGLSDADKEDADLFSENLKQYDEKLSKLNDEMFEGLSNIKTKNVVSFHEAFDYLAEEFGFNIIDTLTTAHDGNISTKKLKSVVDNILKNKPVVLFNELNNKENYANVISGETGCRVFTLDTITNGRSNEPKDDYINRMRENLAILKEALC